MKLTDSLIDEIEHLKKEKEVVILAHTYQISDIQEIADYIGDSLFLAKKIQDIKAKNIVFCGVRFMAETAKVLAPDKNIILPVNDALCPMAAMATKQSLQDFKKQNPEYKIVCYVNSTLETKAESYITCTSSNAIKVVKSLGDSPVLFVPDKNLGGYIKNILAKKNMKLWHGFCNVHDGVKKETVIKLKNSHPNAKVLVHPESRAELVELADFVGSTGAIINYAKENTEIKEFIIITEQGVEYLLNKYRPDAKFYFADMICKNMKKITLDSVYNAIKTLSPSVDVDNTLAQKARIAIQRMLDVG